MAPGGWDGLLWRFGRTRIEVAAPFSDLAGIDRILMPIGGRGLLLHARDHGTIDAREPLRPVAFPGDWAVTSELTEGPVEVLNLMVARGARAIAQHLLGETPTTVPAGDAVLYAFGDEAQVEIGGRSTTVPAGDAMLLVLASPAPVRHVSGGPVALASIAAT